MDLPSMSSFSPSKLDDFCNLGPMSSHMDGVSHLQNNDSRPPPNYHDIDKSCSFHDTAAGECCKHGLYPIAVELLVLLEKTPAPIRTDLCLMASCPERNFKNAHEMLLHLGNCKHYSKRIFRYPAYDASEISQTAPKKSLRDVSKLGQRFHDKLRDFVRCLTSTLPASKEAPTPQSHGQADNQLPGPTLLESQNLSELPCAQDFRCELPASNRSPLFNSPVELPSAAESLSTPYSTDHSPTFSAEPPTVVTTHQLQYECLPYGPNQHMACCCNGSHMARAYVNRDVLQQIHPHNMLSPPMPAAFQLSPGQHIGPGPSLTVQTNLEPNTDSNSPAWDLSHSSGSSWLDDSMDYEESPSGDWLSLPPPSTNTSPLSNPETSLSLLGAARTDLGSAQPHASAPAELKGPCPYCTYKPRGKEKHFKNYIRKHVLKHEGRKKIKCQYCDKEFTRRDNCGAHIRNAHPTRYLQLAPAATETKVVGQ
ncbi:hypothetical protein F5Y05DRAFT_423631 [Hypoxylon sp. FL0543]|nr:hypothetical protein F5Y05DRAFT_423631 [Hypoxylon sp. FL0543]